MSDDKKPDPEMDTSKEGREEEVVTNGEDQNTVTNGSTSDATSLPMKEKTGMHETEGERRFKEGMANNSDTGGS